MVESSCTVRGRLIRVIGCSRNTAESHFCVPRLQVNFSSIPYLKVGVGSLQKWMYDCYHVGMVL